MSNVKVLTKMFLFGRWISTCYADEHLDKNKRSSYNEDFDPSTAMSVLNTEDGLWWKKQLEYFENEVFPNYIKNGSVGSAKEFLK